MKNREDLPELADSDWPARVLKAARSGYAVVADGGSRLLWRNAAFDAYAGEMSQTAEQLAKQSLEEGCAVVPIEFSGQPRQDLQLLELLPTDLVQDEADHQARDDVTGLRPRQIVMAILEDWCASRCKGPFALAFLDLDDFKNVNDEHGHLEGDRCLRRVGDQLKALVRAGDVVGRYGGDEFLILLQGVVGAEGFRPIEQRFLRAFSGVGREAGDLSAIEASFGVAYSIECGNDPKRLIGTADRAMYAAKRAKRAAD